MKKIMLFLLALVLLFNITYSFWTKKDTNTNTNTNGIRGVLTHYQSQYNGNDDSNDAR